MYPLRYRSLDIVARFILKCMRQTERKPGCLHERVLQEVIANLRAGTFTFTPEARELIDCYHRTLVNALHRRCHESYEIKRLVPLRHAMEVHGSWCGVGSAIDYDAMPDIPYRDDPLPYDFSWRTVRWS